MRTILHFCIISILVTLVSCAKEYSYEGGTIPPANSSGGTSGTSNNNSFTYYYKATIGTTDYNQQVTTSNGYMAASASSGSDDVVLSASIRPSQSPYPTNTTSLEVQKGTLHNFSSIKEDQFTSFFSPGNCRYAASGGTIDGVIIKWTDKQGNVWSTTNGSGDQSNSYFIISGYDGGHDASGNLYVRVTALFNCTLYKQTTGEQLQLTNGEFVGKYSKGQ